MKKIGSDLDGVIASNTLNRADYRPFRLHEYYSNAKPTKYSELSFDAIITGRKIHFWKITTEWLKSNNILYKELIMFPNKVKANNRLHAEYKAKKINELGLTKYYEDDKRIAEYLEMACPNAQIVYVDDFIVK